MNYKLKNNYCPYVEKGFRAHIGFDNGKILSTFKPCCNMHRDLLDPEQQELLEVDEDNIEEYINNRHRKYFQHFFKTHDTLHKACLSCELDERNGNLSERQRSIEDDDDSYDIYKLDFTLSNICNLACPFCVAGASSLIDKTSKQYSNNERPFHWDPLSQDYNLRTDKASKLLSGIFSRNKVKYLKLIGGEPFLKGNWETIEFLLEQDYLKHTGLKIITNGTCISKNQLKLLEKAKTVDLTVSVDGIGKNYDFLRWPSTWDNMTRKIDTIHNNAANNTSVGYVSLLNIFNFELAPEIVDHMHSRGLRIEFNPDLKPSNSPLHISSLPLNIFDDALNKLSEENRNYIKAYYDKTKSCTNQSIVHEARFFTRQRNMHLKEVLGPKTYSWLNYIGFE
jgi:MoaA/NifB/PqqE/SkfB family radical SAM enzyme